MRPKSPRGVPTARTRRWYQAVLVAGTVLLPVVGCVYDSSKRCGEGQVLETNGTETCVCASGYAATSTGCMLCGKDEQPGVAGCVCKAGYGRASAAAACVACGENEVTNATGACECVSGFAKASPEAACAVVSAGLGADCDSAATPCTDATYNYCHTVSATAGYCTKQGCASDADCTAGYACDLTSTPAYCRRPPVGFGKVCTSDADCAGTEATYCDLFVTKSCLVQGCTLTPDNCFTGTECCNLSAYGIPQPLCVLLSAGGCTT